MPRRTTDVIRAELRAVVDAMLVIQADMRARIRYLDRLEREAVVV